ncbi:MAG: hypothetical protein KF887_00370 [Paracoccaceae bacterium]|nr:MAG: hypothetical protein KF887_00370 [Paracoccaceae bacterium]
MTLLAKARQNRLTAIAVAAELRKRRAAEAVPAFKSRRTADNLNHAPLAAIRAA